MAEQEFFKFAGRVKTPFSIAIGGKVPFCVKCRLPEMVRQGIEKGEIGLFLDHTGNYFIFNKRNNTLATTDGSLDYTPEGQNFLSGRRGGD